MGLEDDPNFSKLPDQDREARLWFMAQSRSQKALQANHEIVPDCFAEADAIAKERSQPLRDKPLVDVDTAQTAGAEDLVTADFAYVRWLGNRNRIEEQTTTWDKTVIDRRDDLESWVVVLRRLVEDKRIRKIFAFANNHYAGHAPETVKPFRQLWNGGR